MLALGVILLLLLIWVIVSYAYHMSNLKQMQDEWRDRNR